jgi:hypothetical protein
MRSLQVLAHRLTLDRQAAARRLGWLRTRIQFARTRTEIVAPFGGAVGRCERDAFRVLDIPEATAREFGRRIAGVGLARARSEIGAVFFRAVLGGEMQARLLVQMLDAATHCLASRRLARIRIARASAEAGAVLRAAVLRIEHETMRAVFAGEATPNVLSRVAFVTGVGETRAGVERCTTLCNAVFGRQVLADLFLFMGETATGRS